MSFLSRFTHSLVDGFKKFDTKEVMVGTMAALAMVAYANGEFKPEEKEKFLGFIKRDDALRVFKQRDLLETFDDFLETFKFDYGMGEDKALKAVQEIRDAEAAKIMIRGCIALASADGDFDKSEKEAVIKVCDAVSLPSESFGL